jgi:Fe-S cluster biogenesis protein NfuA
MSFECLTLAVTIRSFVVSVDRHGGICDHLRLLHLAMGNLDLLLECQTCRHSPRTLKQGIAMRASLAAPEPAAVIALAKLDGGAGRHTNAANGRKVSMTLPPAHELWL